MANADKQPNETNPPGGTATIPNRLVTNGVCSTCNSSDAHQKTVWCLLCNANFHAICKINDTTLPDNICTESFYKSFCTVTSKAGVNAKRTGNFVFVCDTCLTKHEQGVAADTKSHVKCLETKIDSLESDITVIKNILLNNPKPSSNPPDTATATIEKPTADNIWDDDVRVANLRTKVELVIDKVIPKTDIENIVLDNGIHVHRTYNNPSGNTVLVMPTQNDRSALHTKLKKQFPDSTLREKQELLPTISVANIVENYSTDKLLEIVMKSHPVIKSYVSKGSVFTILNIRKQRKNEMFQANIRVSNNIRQYIENLGDRLFLGLTSCLVYDHFHIKRCDRCQKFGHYKANCREQHVCLHCAENHATESCNKKGNVNFTPTCASCKHLSGQYSDINFNHRADYVNCPSFMNARDKLRGNIMYYSSKNC